MTVLQRQLLWWSISTVALTVVAIGYAMLEGIAHRYLAAHWLFVPLTWPVDVLIRLNASYPVQILALFANASVVSAAFVVVSELIGRRR